MGLLSVTVADEFRQSSQLHQSLHSSNQWTIEKYPGSWERLPPRVRYRVGFQIHAKAFPASSALISNQKIPLLRDTCYQSRYWNFLCHYFQLHKWWFIRQPSYWSVIQQLSWENANGPYHCIKKQESIRMRLWEEKILHCLVLFNNPPALLYYP